MATTQERVRTRCGTVEGIQPSRVLIGPTVDFCPDPVLARAVSEPDEVIRAAGLMLLRALRVVRWDGKEWDEPATTSDERVPPGVGEVIAREMADSPRMREPTDGEECAHVFRQFEGGVWRCVKCGLTRDGSQDFEPIAEGSDSAREEPKPFEREFIATQLYVKVDGGHVDLETYCEGVESVSLRPDDADRVADAITRAAASIRRKDGAS